MTSWVVADSSVFLAAVLEETLSKQADALISLWRYEVIAVIRRNVHRASLTASEADSKLKILMKLEQSIHFELDDYLLQRAYDLATQYNRPTTYDTQYLAVAEHFGCDFWTADEKLFNAVKQHLSWVKWLGNFPN